jgi:UDP-glucose:(heptosyl)LPS alpha-1,3-glucosyltransferase
MRLALVVERFDPDGGGGEQAAWSFAHALARAGDEVHVAARDGVESAAVRLHRLRVPRAWQPLRVAAFSRAAARWAAAGGYDRVLSFARTRHQHVYRAGGGSHADYMRRRYAGGHRARRLLPRHAVLLAAERRIFADPHQLVVCASHRVRDEIESRYGVPDHRLCVIRNGVDLERFHPRHRDGDGARLRRAMGAGAGPVWLFAGSGFARKGLDTALRAFAAGAPRSGRLWVTGRDAVAPWRAQATLLGIGDRVRFLGLRRDMPAIYGAADALLLPTRYDAFANVCLEAAAAGLPAVTSGLAGSEEVLGEAACVVVDPEDFAGFAAAVRRLSDAGLRRHLGAAARSRAEGCAWEPQAARLRERLQAPPP